MKAAVYYGQKDIRVEDVALPSPAEGELLIAISSVGICGTDAAEFEYGPSLFPISHRHAVTGHSGPMVPGHEFAGVVAGVGAGVTGFSEGDLVTSGAGISCGSCSMCQAGRTNLCASYSTVGLERNGGLAEFTTAPAVACVNLEQRSISSDVAALAQPMSIAVHAMRRGQISRGDDVVVLGAGAIGAFLIHAASREGANVTAVDLDPRRLEAARALGATATVQTNRDSSITAQLLAQGLQPKITYECTGVPPAVEAAVTVTERGGRIVIVGLQKKPVPVELLAVTLQEKELTGTMAHVFNADFGHAVDLVENERDLWALVAPDVLPLDDLVDEGLRPMIENRDTPIKTLLDPRIESKRPIDVGQNDGDR
ncbi:MAG: alcohol dehydrogenase catalytic domain-containing protein [Acidimicrobiia bacterium]|nr:alcohol dehydrogenase catalytic domain-containing protein [Acidimicrobiia bacterium]